MDWRTLLNDRRVQIGGVVAAAGAGAYVLWRKRAAGGDGASSAAGSTPGGGAPPAAGYPNTTGTDVAYWVGVYQQQQQDWLQNYLRSLGLDGLDQIPTTEPRRPQLLPAIQPAPTRPLPQAVAPPTYGGRPPSWR